jgi:hypothetical protein
MTSLETAPTEFIERAGITFAFKDHMMALNLIMLG